MGPVKKPDSLETLLNSPSRWNGHEMPVTFGKWSVVLGGYTVLRMSWNSDANSFIFAVNWHLGLTSKDEYKTYDLSQIGLFHNWDDNTFVRGCQKMAAVFLGLPTRPRKKKQKLTKKILWNIVLRKILKQLLSSSATTQRTVVIWNF